MGDVTWKYCTPLSPEAQADPRADDADDTISAAADDVTAALMAYGRALEAFADGRVVDAAAESWIARNRALTAASRLASLAPQTPPDLHMPGDAPPFGSPTFAPGDDPTRHLDADDDDAGDVR